MLSCSHSPIQGFSIGVNEFKLFKTEGDRGGERKGKHGAPKQIAMVSGGSARPHATGKYIMLTGSAGFGSTALTSPWMIGQRQPSLCAPATGPAALALERNAARPLQQLDCGVGGGTARPVRNVPQGASPDEAVTEFTAAGGAGTGGDGGGGRMGADDEDPPPGTAKNGPGTMLHRSQHEHGSGVGAGGVGTGGMGTTVELRASSSEAAAMAAMASTMTRWIRA